MGFLSLTLLTFLSSVMVRGEKDRVTFFNSESTDSALYISKEITAASAHMDAPSDDSFVFFLKLNGKEAREVSFRLFGGDGKEIYNYNGTLTTKYSKDQIPTPFQTDYNGSFLLKGGETAFFSGIRPGTGYEIREEEHSDYIQTDPPVGIPAVGTVLPEGTRVRFQNLYSPETGNDREFTSLDIRKDILFPKGFSPPESPLFKFCVTVDNRPWANEAYTLIHLATKRVEARGVTDDKGAFLMRGGYLAHFENVPCHADYLVSESSVDGWRSVTPQSYTGVLKSPVTSLFFANTETAFAVTKELEDETLSSDPFLFELKRDGQLWEGAGYYLYTVSGRQVDHALHRTDEKGRFALLGGQAAVFTGIPLHTRYSVAECADKKFVQTFPPDPQGYTDRLVSQSAEILHFRNRPADNPACAVELFVHKKGEDQLPLEGAVFCLYRDKAQTEELCRSVSDKDGLADFGKIEPGTYYLREELSPPGYCLMKTCLKLKIEEEGIWVNETCHKYGSSAGDVSSDKNGETIGVHITVHNHRNFRLPFTGGNGSILFLLMGAAGLLWFGRQFLRTE